MPEPGKVSSQSSNSASVTACPAPAQELAPHKKYGNYALHHIYKLHTMPTFFTPRHNTEL
jgi:hypothetical protein